MNCASRRAFTLIEMLVVVVLIGLLIAILLPVLGLSKRTAKASLCQWNVNQLMTAVNLYLKDNNDIYPGDEIVVRDADGKTQTVEINSWNVMGSMGTPGGDTTPAELRPLNSYLSEPAVARCPMDEGSSLSAEIGEAASHYGTFGSSYYYLARAPKQINDRKMEIRDGAQMIGGHRKSEFARPDRKAVLADAILPVSFSHKGTKHFAGDHRLNAWHSMEAEQVTSTSTTRRLGVVMGFVDGHVEQVRRRAGDWIADPNPNLNAAAADVEALLNAPAVADSSEVDELYY